MKGFKKNPHKVNWLSTARKQCSMCRGMFPGHLIGPLEEELLHGGKGTVAACPLCRQALVNERLGNPRDTPPPSSAPLRRSYFFEASAYRR